MPDGSGETTARALKWRQVTLLAVGELMAMTLWFSASAVVPQLTEQWHLSGVQAALLTISVQIGFVGGAFLSAALNVADRFQIRWLVAGGALAGAFFNALIPISGRWFCAVLALRFFTGAALAGVYPPGMKLIATWCRKDLGFGIGLLIGALTLGSAMPHLLNILPLPGRAGMPPWPLVIYCASGIAVLGGILIAVWTRPGPFLAKSAPFDPGVIGRTFSYRPTRLATFGYLGHMWELYAVWAWAPLFLLASYQNAGWPLSLARLAGFATIAVGALGCLLAGLAADRIGRTRTTIISMIVSGSCCLLAGLMFEHPGLLTVLCLIWGFAVVADSAQFSAAISELADPSYVGTALTLQTSAGFLLTLLTIWIIPELLPFLGWKWVFCLLAIGPFFGVWSMADLRAHPHAVRMTSGRR